MERLCPHPLRLQRRHPAGGRGAADPAPGVSGGAGGDCPVSPQPRRPRPADAPGPGAAGGGQRQVLPERLPRGQRGGGGGPLPAAGGRLHPGADGAADAQRLPPGAAARGGDVLGPGRRQDHRGPGLLLLPRRARGPAAGGRPAERHGGLGDAAAGLLPGPTGAVRPPAGRGAGHRPAPAGRPAADADFLRAVRHGGAAAPRLPGPPPGGDGPGREPPHQERTGGGHAPGDSAGVAPAGAEADSLRDALPPVPGGPDSPVFLSLPRPAGGRGDGGRRLPARLRPHHQGAAGTAAGGAPENLPGDDAAAAGTLRVPALGDPAADAGHALGGGAGHPPGPGKENHEGPGLRLQPLAPGRRFGVSLRLAARGAPGRGRRAEAPLRLPPGPGAGGRGAEGDYLVPVREKRAAADGAPAGPGGRLHRRQRADRR